MSGLLNLFLHLAYVHEHTLRISVSFTIKCCIKVQYSQVHFSLNNYFKIFANITKVIKMLSQTLVWTCASKLRIMSLLLYSWLAFIDTTNSEIS